MILLTDGQDEGSQLRIKDAIEAAQKSDSIVYVLLCADRGFYGGFGGYSGDSEMKKLAQETGGRGIEVGNKYDKLKEGFAQIANELRSQYNVGYSSTNAKLDGTFRKVEIHATNKDYKIQSRSGYYAVPKPDWHRTQNLCGDGRPARPSGAKLLGPGWSFTRSFTLITNFNPDQISF